jgi:hypothetical protein
MVDTLKAVDIESHVSSAFIVYVSVHEGAGRGVSEGCVPSAYPAGVVKLYWVAPQLDVNEAKSSANSSV